MTTVNVTTAKLNNAIVPVSGTIRATYWQGSAPATLTKGEKVVIAEPVILTAGPVDMLATGLTSCVRWEVSTSAGKLTRYTSIPDSGTVDFADLPDVSPYGFERTPLTATVAEWIAALKTGPQGIQGVPGSVTPEFVALADQVDADADRAGTSAFNAASSAASAQSSEDDARAARTGAETARTGAETARTGAEAARTAAETARDLAQAAPFASSQPAANTSLDTLTSLGIYRITWGATVAQGAPFETFYGTVEVQPRGTGAVTQIARKHNALSADSGQFWQRTQTGAGWGAWFTYSSSRTTTAGEVFMRTGLTTEAQLGTVGAPLGQADLNTFVTAGTFLQSQGAYATLARNYPRANVAGVLEVLPLASGALIQRFSIYYGSGPNATMGYYVRRQNGGFWDAWRFTATQRIDKTAGIAIYTYDDIALREQIVYGDTGRRDITSLFGAAVTVGSVLIQRYGRHVTITLNNVTVPTGASTVAGIIPVGFRITGAGVYPVGYAPNTATVWSDGNINLPTGSGRYGSFTYLTEQAWPTSLPGTADGSIPNA